MIVGSGRSGTTFIGKLFDSHPWVRYLNEPDAVQTSPGLPFLPTAEEDSIYRDQAARYLTELEAAHSPSSAGKLPLLPKAYRTRTGRLLFEASVFGAKGISRVPGLQRVERMRIPSFARKSDRESGRIVTIIKSVVSLNRAPMFAAARPGLKIIHITRHPCGVVASELRGLRTGVWKTDVYPEAFLALGRDSSVPYLRGYSPAQFEALGFEEQLTLKWMLRNDSVWYRMQGNPNYRLVRYEDLCRAPGAVMDELFSFTGLSVEPQTRGFIGELERSGEARQGYFSVMQSPSRSAEKWKTELSEDQIRRITTLAAQSRSGSLYT